ncbi:Uncharacterised protein [Mycobacterium tuberculosis]|uniref:Uncharacterized protein n=1 Tax=Mycobacterium tuberculosis TaxID=1773 RepID=A0A916P8D8_MYCTX|nr:Uncharacterised protein [Mycobacterium tuberculosis]
MRRLACALTISTSRSGWSGRSANASTTRTSQSAKRCAVARSYNSVR